MNKLIFMLLIFVPFSHSTANSLQPTDFNKTTINCFIEVYPPLRYELPIRYSLDIQLSMKDGGPSNNYNASTYLSYRINGKSIGKTLEIKNQVIGSKPIQVFLNSKKINELNQAEYLLKLIKKNQSLHNPVFLGGEFERIKYVQSYSFENSNNMPELDIIVVFDSNMQEITSFVNPFPVRCES